MVSLKDTNRFLTIFKQYLLILSIIFTNINAETIKAFTSDGCSMVADGTRNNPTLWQNCCIRHDIEYWMGGSFEDRRKADETFGKCIESKAGSITGSLMYLGVRIGGNPYLTTSFRWGYGWSYGRWYKKRTPEQEQLVQKMKLWWPKK